MPLTGRKEKTLDGREIIELWIELESLGRVARFYASKGKVNPRTGQPFTQNALWRSASNFLVNNPVEGREYYRQAGAVYTDSEWEQFILRRAMQVYKANRSGFLRWVISQEWPKKYEHLYRNEYGVEQQDYDYFTQTMRRMPKRGGRQFKNSGDIQK